LSYPCTEQALPPSVYRPVVLRYFRANEEPRRQFEHDIFDDLRDQERERISHPTDPSTHSSHWFEQILSAAQILELLIMRDQTNEYQNKILSDLVKNVWPKLREYSIGRSILLIENLPQLPASKHSELLSSLSQLLKRHINVVDKSWVVPLTPQNQENKRFVFVEVQNTQNIENILKELNKLKFSNSRLTGKCDVDMILKQRM
jgi:hypothetical protein